MKRSVKLSLVCCNPGPHRKPCKKLTESPLESDYRYLSSFHYIFYLQRYKHKLQHYHKRKIFLLIGFDADRVRISILMQIKIRIQIPIGIKTIRSTCGSYHKFSHVVKLTFILSNTSFSFLISEQ